MGLPLEELLFGAAGLEAVGFEPPGSFNAVLVTDFEFDEEFVGLRLEVDLDEEPRASGGRSRV